MNKIEILLGTLPASAQDIADLFRLQGIRGVPKDVTGCPIATYLKEGGVLAPIVGGTIAYVKAGGLCVEMPKGCSEFVGKFDCGYYPDLKA